LDPKIIEKVLGDAAITRHSTFILTGGEFLLHPKHREIISLFNKRGNPYILLSNGLLPEQLVRTVKEFNVPHLSLSLDGPPETYARTRGVDGYSKVEKVIEDLKGSDTRLSVGYTVNPWNSREDLIHVMKFSKEHNVDLNIGYYCTMEYYDTKVKMGSSYTVDDLVDQPYHILYSSWVSGKLNMPCLSIFLRPVIRPNGDVELCEPLQIKLGNLYEDSLSKIWRNERTLSLQKKFMYCNSCWHDAQRGCDIRVLSIIKLFIPTPLLKTLYPKFDWSKIYASIK
jgi:radical SAM protein with 4Fe4S-binding SPASM domain